MKSLALSLSIALCFLMSTEQSDGTLQNQNTQRLRDQLRTANDTASWFKGEHPYVALMRMGYRGFETLANAWAYDNIPEENWLQWDTDSPKKTSRRSIFQLQGGRQ
jgi:hypothetical protein